MNYFDWEPNRQSSCSIVAFRFHILLRAFEDCRQFLWWRLIDNRWGQLHGWFRGIVSKRMLHRAMKQIYVWLKNRCVTANHCPLSKHGSMWLSIDFSQRTFPRLCLSSANTIQSSRFPTPSVRWRNWTCRFNSMVSFWIHCSVPIVSRLVFSKIKRFDKRQNLNASKWLPLVLICG